MKVTEKVVEQFPPPKTYVLECSEGELLRIALLSYRHELCATGTIFGQVPQSIKVLIWDREDPKQQTEKTTSTYHLEGK